MLFGYQADWPWMLPSELVSGDVKLRAVLVLVLLPVLPESMTVASGSSITGAGALGGVLLFIAANSLRLGMRSISAYRTSTHYIYELHRI